MKLVKDYCGAVFMVIEEGVTSSGSKYKKVQKVCDSTYKKMYSTEVKKNKINTFGGDYGHEFSIRSELDRITEEYEEKKAVLNALLKLQQEG